jgi:hypothetical protein
MDGVAGQTSMCFLHFVMLLCCFVCLQAIVQSFLGFGLQGLKPRMGGWGWAELQEINAAIHWQVGGVVGG